MFWLEKSKAEIYGMLQNISFSGAPVQCDPETCKTMRKTIDFAPTMGLEEANKVGCYFSGRPLFRAEVLHCLYNLVQICSGS